MLRGLKIDTRRVLGEKGNLRSVKIPIVTFRHATDLFLSNYIRKTSPGSKVSIDQVDNHLNYTHSRFIFKNQSNFIKMRMVFVMLKRKYKTCKTMVAQVAGDNCCMFVPQPIR